MGRPDKSFNTICRVCLSHEDQDKMVSLIDTSQETGLSVYGSCFEEITKIPVCQNKYIPMNICERCRKSLEDVSRLIVTCESSDRKLRKLIKFCIHQDLDGAMVNEVVCQYVLFAQSCDLDSKTILDQPGTSQPMEESSEIHTLTAKSIHITNEADNRAVNTSNHIDDIFFDFTGSDSIQNTTQNKTDIVDIFINSIKNLLFQVKDSNPERKKEKENERIFSTNLKEESKPKKKLKLDEGYTCNICQKVLASPTTLEHHMLRHGSCRFVCDQCGKRYPINAELVNHQVHSHGCSSQYECDMCSYRAYRRIDLVEHIRLHTGERPFACEKCGLTFRRRTLYNKHTRFHGEPTISCDLCPRKFFVRSALLEHKNSKHNREYFYSCKHCNASYALAKTVKKHMLNKHGIPRHLQGKVQKVFISANVTYCKTRRGAELM